MAEVVNLRLARKARARSAAEREAEANRARFGRDKAEKARQRADADRAAHHLDGVKREGSD